MLIFRARERLCAIPLERLAETMRALPLAPFPGSPSFVLGVARIRGLTVPIVDVGAVLGLGGESRATRFLSLKLASGQAALAVESVLGVRPLEAETLSALPPLLGSSDEGAVRSIGIADAELLLCLDATRIVPEDLWAAISRPAPA